MVTFILITIYLLVTNANIYRNAFESLSSKFSEYYRSLVKGEDYAV